METNISTIPGERLWNIEEVAQYLAVWSPGPTSTPTRAR